MSEIFGVFREQEELKIEQKWSAKGSAMKMIAFWDIVSCSLVEVDRVTH
jgi:hypothetical protein